MKKIRILLAAILAVALLTSVLFISEAEPAVEAPVVDFNQVTPVKSPMVGVFYAAPSPEKPPFVKVGDHVKKGDVLCIIEAMKLMNEIPAECGGEVVEICVGNGQNVDYGCTLFKIRR